MPLTRDISADGAAGASDDDEDAASDEAQLVAALQRGEEAAFRIVIERYGPSLLKTAARMLGQRDQAQDCVQEALILAFRKVDEFEQRSTLKTWLHRVCINCALGMLRKRRPDRELALDDYLPSFDDQDFLDGPASLNARTADELIQDTQVRKQVRDAVDSLPQTYREVLLLRDFEEMSTREVATQLGLTETATKVRLHRARSALKKILEPLFLAGNI